MNKVFDQIKENHLKCSNMDLNFEREKKIVDFLIFLGSFALF